MYVQRNNTTAVFYLGTGNNCKGGKIMVKEMKVVFLSALLVFCLTLTEVPSSYAISTEESIEPNQTTSQECMAGTVYLQSVCFFADGNINKCLNLMLLYGVPCVIFKGITGDNEITIGKCFIGLLYVATTCLASDGDVLKCLELALATFHLPCMYRALNNFTNDPDPSS
jgi:hypothetical protein